ncbi:hypothetical protein [Prevotella sp. P3-122]|uniref:hypothetical protein n=1 Tax=Prevotella sp. P3-122 TaxID=2024223 RepID=UPI000B9710BA|nr:hypothetical protein [Prevotella sp. P3-122]OYP63404.1 hypothetical protein CIL02_01430 [Prevotella sp. P3-122]
MEYAEKRSLLPKCRSSTAVEGVNVSHFGDARRKRKKREKENAESLTLPDRVVDAYAQGALPLNTLANAVLARHDQMRQMASENYEANERETIVRPLAQR